MSSTKKNVASRSNVNEQAEPKKIHTNMAPITQLVSDLTDRTEDEILQLKTERLKLRSEIEKNDRQLATLSDIKYLRGDTPFMPYKMDTPISFGIPPMAKPNCGCGGGKLFIDDLHDHDDKVKIKIVNDPWVLIEMLIYGIAIGMCISVIILKKNRASNNRHIIHFPEGVPAGHMLEV